MSEIHFEFEHTLLLIRNFQSTTSQIKKPLSLAAGTLQIIMQLVVHKPAFSPHLNEICVLHDLQMMGNRHNFRIKQLRDISNCQLTIPQRVHNLQAMRITQRLQAFRAEFGIKDFLGHVQHLSEMTI